MAVDPFEEFVQKIGDLDTDINTVSENMKKRPLTAQEIETFKGNVLLRYKLNEQLVEMRGERSRRDAP